VSVMPRVVMAVGSIVRLQCRDEKYDMVLVWFSPGEVVRCIVQSW
jgi:hypothetical protein